MSMQPIQPALGAPVDVRTSEQDDTMTDEITQTMVRQTKPHLAEVTQTYVAIPLPSLSDSATDAVSSPRPPAPAKIERTVLPVINEPVTSLAASSVSTAVPRIAAADFASLSPDEVQQLAAKLGVEPAQLPRLLEQVRNQLGAQQMTLEHVLAVTSTMKLSNVDALAALVALVAPQRGEEVATPQGEAALFLAVYVTAFAGDRFAATLPAPEALRVAASGAEPLSRMPPEKIALTGLAMNRIASSMTDMTRPEAMAAVSSLVATCPDALARSFGEQSLDERLNDARQLAAHMEGNRGLALAAAFVALANTSSHEEAQKIVTQAVNIAGHAAPQLLLSAARQASRTLETEAVRRAALADASSQADDESRSWSERWETAVTKTHDRVNTFLNQFDVVTAKLLNPISRPELVQTLHSQLTRGGEQFYVALLSLLRRNSALCTRQGSRGLRNLIVKPEDRGFDSSLPSPVFA